MFQREHIGKHPYAHPYCLYIVQTSVFISPLTMKQYLHEQPYCTYISKIWQQEKNEKNDKHIVKFHIQFLLSTKTSPFPMKNSVRYMPMVGWTIKQLKPVNDMFSLQLFYIRPHQLIKLVLFEFGSAWNDGLRITYLWCWRSVTVKVVCNS